jgi:uncharacterized protein involved in exopolysaccharide biosynthesis
MNEQDHAAASIPRQRRKPGTWFVIGAALGLLIGGGVVVLQPATYTAVGSLLFPAASASISLTRNAGAAGDADHPVALDADSALVLLRSRRIDLAEAAKADLKKVWHVQTDSDVLRRFQRRLICNTGKHGELLIGFRDEQPQRALAVASDLIQALDDAANAMGLNPARDRVRYFEGKLGYAEQGWQQAQQALQDFQQKNHVASFRDEEKALVDQYSLLRKQSLAAKVEASVAMHAVDVLGNLARRRIAAFSDPNPGSDNLLGKLYQRANALGFQLDDLKKQPKADPSALQAVTQQFEDAQRLLKAEMDRQMTMLNNGSAPVLAAALARAVDAQARAANLDAAVTALQKEVAALPAKQAAYTQITAQLDEAQTAIATYDPLLRKARIAADELGPAFQIVDAPALPQERDYAYGLDLLIVLGVGVLGLLLVALLPAPRPRSNISGDLPVS